MNHSGDQVMKPEDLKALACRLESIAGSNMRVRGGEDRATLKEAADAILALAGLKRGERMAYVLKANLQRGLMIDAAMLDRVAELVDAEAPKANDEDREWALRAMLQASEGGKEASQANPSAHVASATETEAQCDLPRDLEAQIDHWLDDAIAQEWPAEGWCGRVAKHIAKGIRSEREESAAIPSAAMPKAVVEACEVVRTDAANTMQHDTTSDLTPRLMCRVDVRKLGLVLAWVGQFTPTTGATDCQDDARCPFPSCECLRSTTIEDLAVEGCPRLPYPSDTQPLRMEKAP